MEALCAQVESEIKALAARQGFNITRRYSPGMVISLESQAPIVSILNAYRQLGAGYRKLLLIPRKPSPP